MIITIQIQDKQDFKWITPFLESLKTNTKARVEISEETSSSKQENLLEIDKKVALPQPLRHIGLAIEEGKSMLVLPENWDDEGAMPIEEETFQRASNFLMDYSQWLLHNLKVRIESPQISPGPDGSIDILWRTGQYRMLINIPQNKNQHVGYYGDDYKDNNSIKGRVPAIGVKEYLALWLKNLQI